ncbi:hypothetical protein ACLOJK_009455 [Asimina triloba]
MNADRGRMVGAAEEESLLGSEPEALFPTPSSNQIPKDTFHLAYTAYFILGVGFLLPWNAFANGIDYFAYITPASMSTASSPLVRTNSGLALYVLPLSTVPIIDLAYIKGRVDSGLALYVLSLSTVPIIDLAYIKGRVELFRGFYVDVAAVGLCGAAKPLVESGVVGAAGELPVRYMQATGAGQAASGVIVSLLRIITKAMYPHNASGLRRSANLYFGISIFVMLLCIICCYISEKLPVIRCYKHLKIIAKEEEEEKKKKKTQIHPIKSQWRSDMGKVASRVKWLAFARFLCFVVFSSIFPGHLTEDVHSPVLKDWHPIFLITCFHVSNLLGTSLPAMYLINNERSIFIAAVLRLVFYPLFLGCRNGPGFLKTELALATLTCLLGLSQGYFATVPLILAPKKVPIQLAEEAGISMLFFTEFGLLIGSVASWLWII